MSEDGLVLKEYVCIESKKPRKTKKTRSLAVFISFTYALYP